MISNRRRGRYIGENTRFVFELMAFPQSKHITGLFVCIHFEKAFKSISWQFIRFSIFLVFEKI